MSEKGPIRVSLPTPDLRALAAGETVVAFVSRGSVSPGDEPVLVDGGPRRPDQLKPAYRRLAEVAPPEGAWRATVVAVQPARALAGPHGDPRHILQDVPDGDVAVLRVSGPAGPVLSDVAFAARVRSVGLE